VQVGGRNIFTNIQAARGTLPFLVTAQDAELTFTSAKDNKVFRTTRLQPAPRKTMLLIALGTAGSPQFFQIGSDTALTDSNSWLQLINAGTGMPPVQVEFIPRQIVTPTNASGSSIDRGTAIPRTATRLQGQIIAPRLEFGQLIPDFPVPSGSYTLNVYEVSSGKLIGSLDLDSSAGHRYDVLILPAANGKATLNLYTTTDLAQPQ